MKILICGLPGSGKTTLAEKIAPMINAVHLNADKVREEANDWDFSEAGRMRQAERMRLLSAQAVLENRIVIADFICPTKYARKEYNADFTVWMDTIKEGRFEDTNKIFEPLEEYDVKVTHMDADTWVFIVKQELVAKFGNLTAHNKGTENV